MRIGILGGSFDPVHAGHVKLALAAADELNLDRVIFVPALQNPLKSERPSLSAAQRVRLLRRRLARHPRLSVSRVELDRRVSGYTVDTLRFFKKKYGKSATLYFLAGADVAPGLKRWRSWRTVLRLCRFVVCSRPGYRVSKLPDGVSFMAFDAAPLSSTAIRARAA